MRPKAEPYHFPKAEELILEEEKPDESPPPPPEEEAKSEELFIEEFVSSTRAHAAS